MVDPIPVSLADAALRGTALAMLLLLAGALRRDRPRLASSQSGIALALGLCVQVVGTTPWLEAELTRLWRAPLVAVALGNAVLFWIFVRALFDDDFRVRPWHVGAWLMVAGLGGLNCAVVASSGSAFAPITMGVQQVVPLVCAVLAAMAAAQHWRDDLIDQRRRLRVFIVVTGIVYTIFTLAARVGTTNGRLSGPTATLDIAALTAIVAVVAAQMLRMGGSELFPAHAGPIPGGSPTSPSVLMPTAEDDETLEDTAVPDPAEARLAEALQRAMAVDRLYRTEDLTVSSLAARLAVPEYRLRRLINRRLGHRNFNAYVNGFRLEDARAALADPRQRGLPILSIALEAGFQSIGPFNRAFKAATGLTPSDFRREHLADS